MTEYKDPMVFAEGMNFQEVAPNAPETIRGKIWFDVKKFIEFLKANENEKGFVNTKMMKSKKHGGIYFILDTWKPAPKVDPELEALRNAHQASINKIEEPVDADAIPF